MDLSELKRQSADDFKRHPWEIARARIVHFLLKRYCPGIRNIADIGSGDAYILQQLNARGIEGRFAAVDTGYNHDVISQLKNNLAGMNVQFFGLKEELEKNSGKIDLFLFLDVLEHCKDDTAVLSSYVQSPGAEKGTLFFITVPAYQGLWSAHDVLLGHYRRYTRRQIEAICKQENLKILRTGYFFCTLLPLRWGQLLLEKAGLRKPVNSIDNWTASPILSKLILAILWLDFCIGYGLSKAGINLPGLSCYCVCQKS